MGAPGQSPLDGNPLATPPIVNGYRATVSDFDGAAFEDDPEYPPDPATMGTAAWANTLSLCAVSLMKAVGVAGFGINAGASPSFAWYWTGANNIAGNPFTLTRNAAGDYSINWAANLFPVFGWPRARINTLIGATNASIAAVNITNGIRVQTTQGGVLTDLSFSAEVF